MDTPAATRFSEELVAAGFLSVGGFHPDDGDLVPPTEAGETASTVLIIGSAGQAFWTAFRKSPEASDGRKDPMDRFTRRVLGALGRKYGFSALFPFEGPPYHPFQRWVLRCGGYSQSPIGVLVNEAHGPWTGLRAAFVSEQTFGTFDEQGTSGPCESCRDKPCLTACPVNAISLEAGYDVGACRDHLRGSETAECWSGCLARRACPFGSEHRQVADNARFHMQSFTGMT